MPKSFIVVGLGFGDEGKGSWVDYLCRRHKIGTVIRFNGGAQAAHHVVSPEGITHCFSQFGSGTLCGAKTILSQFVLINPQSFLAEAQTLKEKGVETHKRVMVDRNCPIITPFNLLLNRIREISRGSNRHGSCGAGVGITQGDVETLGDRALYVRDFLEPEKCLEKIHWLWKLKLQEAELVANSDSASLLDTFRRVDLKAYWDYYNEFCRMVEIIETEKLFELLRKEDVVFEGAQGVLLDQRGGFFPHITRSNTTFVNALKLLQLSNSSGDITKIGLLRGYGSRHGAGPFIAEDSSLKLPPCHNGENPWQGKFRLGWFDAIAARYALELVEGVDILAITNLDRMFGLETLKVCSAYSSPNQNQFFGSIAGTIKEIKVLKDATRETLAARTEALKQLRPEYHSYLQNIRKKNYRHYPEILESHINHKIRAVSLSSTAEGKIEF